MKKFVARVIVTAALTVTVAGATGATVARADCETASGDSYCTTDTYTYGTGDSSDSYTTVGSMDYGTGAGYDITPADMYYIGCAPSTTPCPLTTGLGGQ